jgi:CTP synthase (UTP-ammonia lyase)
MTAVSKIALLGDESAHPSHQALNELIPRLGTDLGVEARWVPTDSSFDISEYDGVWLVPGSPYADDAAVLAALRVVRESGTPFLGTCGGMQYAVIEYVRNVLGRAGTHAESEGVADDNVVSGLACSLQGEQRLVTPVRGTRFADWCPEPFVGMHFCSFGVTAEAIAMLEAAGVVVGATAPDAGAEVLEFPDHLFYVTSMFQPHVAVASGNRIHPLIAAFLSAVLSSYDNSNPR